MGQRVPFEQSSCEVFPDSGSGSQNFVFLPLLSKDGNGQIGFAGFTLRTDFITERLLPSVVSDVLANVYPSRNDSGPVISVVDENEHEVYVSLSGSKPREINRASLAA